MCHREAIVRIPSGGFLGQFSIAGMLLAILAGVSLQSVFAQSQEWPDIRTIDADLVVPAMADIEPASGRRVRRSLPGRDASKIYHALYLPGDWSEEQSLPVIVEYSGNGGYRDPLGDVCTGRPEDCNFGYGLSAGEGFIWICLPYLNNEGTEVAATWWGNPPEYDPKATLNYCHEAINDICAKFNGDRQKIILCGFSRGAIACNYLGLYDDETANLWRAFVPCSHYDGVRRWPYPHSDVMSASTRLARLGDRPQFICGEKNQTEETRRYLTASGHSENLTFLSTGFRNHSDQWILRPSPARDSLRSWLKGIVEREIQK